MERIMMKSRVGSKHCAKNGLLLHEPHQLGPSYLSYLVWAGIYFFTFFISLLKKHLLNQEV